MAKDAAHDDDYALALWTVIRRQQAQLDQLTERVQELQDACKAGAVALHNLNPHVRRLAADMLEAEAK